MSGTIREALIEATARLRGAGIDGAERDARVLMAAALDIAKDRLTLCANDPLADDPGARFEAFIGKRLDRMPVARIIEKRMFWGHEFWVTPDVLDPRPDTEILIAAAMLAGPFERFLDLGTGCGIIAITLLLDWEQAQAVGTDISLEALAVTEVNAINLGVQARLELVPSDWFFAVRGSFDLIVVNPPYIAAAEMPTLAPEVRFYDPEIALTDGGDGLGAYRAIAAGLPVHLRPGGLVLVEIGPTQAGVVSALLRDAGLENIAVYPDLDGRDRVVGAQMPV